VLDEVQLDPLDAGRRPVALHVVQQVGSVEDAGRDHGRRRGRRRPQGEQFGAGGGVAGVEAQGAGVGLAGLLPPVQEFQRMAQVQLEIGVLRLQPLRLLVEQQRGLGVAALLRAMPVLHPDLPMARVPAEVAGVELGRVGPVPPVPQRVGPREQVGGRKAVRAGQVHGVVPLGPPDGGGRNGTR
jgi:hypothetical protein